jgi:NAD(P)H-flavin reductase
MMGKLIDENSYAVKKTTKSIVVLPPDSIVIEHKVRSIANAVRRAQAICLSCRMCTDLCPRYLLGHDLYPDEMMKKMYRGELGEGDIIGVRGPLGNHFPMHEFHGKNLIVLGGGIGGAPLRPVIHTVLNHRQDYGQLTILWAARHPSLLVFTDEYDDWRAAPDTKLHLTVDQPDSKWDHNIGLITDLLERVAPSPENAITITCGPPIMIHYVNKMLVEKLGFLPEQNYVTLEARMHCGLGKCGRCNLGEKLVCVDGPVFTMQEVGELLESFL